MLMGWSTIATAAIGDLDWTNKIGASLGYSSNVYQLSDNAKADFFTEFSAKSAFKPTPDIHAAISADYTSYFKETEENVLLWALSAGKQFGAWDGDLKLHGQNYSHGGPGYYDENFDYMGLVASLSREWPFKQERILELNPTYELRDYNTLNRTDQILGINGFLDWKLAQNKTLSPMMQFEWVSSSDSAFNRLSFLLRVDYLLNATDTLKNNFFVAYKISSYPDRTVTVEETVLKGRGRAQTTSLDSKEETTLTTIGASTTKSVGAGEVRGALEYDDQSSISGYLNYSEVLLTASYIYKF